MSQARFEWCHLPDSWAWGDEVPQPDQWRLLAESQQKRMRGENHECLYVVNQYGWKTQYNLRTEDVNEKQYLFQSRYVEKLLVRRARTVLVSLHAGRRQNSVRPSETFVFRNGLFCRNYVTEPWIAVMEDVSARRFQARFAATGSWICEMDFPTEHKIRVSQIVSRLQECEAIGRRADVKVVHGADPLEGSTCLWNPQAPKAKPMRRCRAKFTKAQVWLMQYCQPLSCA